MNQFLAEFVRERAGNWCEYCQMPAEFDFLVFEIDHIIARQHGGQTVAGNLALTCFTCNHFKGPNLSGIDPATKRIVRLFHPRRHRWSYHFRWDGPQLVGRTAIGRATISTLALNLFDRVRLREELIQQELFPPQ